MLIISLINNIWTQINNWREVSSQRRQLRNNSDNNLLNDIGISRIDADRDANRPFWEYSRDYDQSLRARAKFTISDIKAEEINISCCGQN